MRAFASDLDRTLIYSKRMIEEYETNESYELIETLNGEEISYIALKTKAALKRLSEEMLFIPVTTRTIEQYTRIELFQNELQPEYAITSNGGTILRAGQPIKEWSEIIQEKLSESLPLHDMMKKIENFSNTQWIERIRQAEQLFIYLIIDRHKVSKQEITKIKQWANDCGWQTSLQGRKLYFVPKPVNKWNATHYLCQKLKINEIYSAGDSLLDYELIKYSHYGISPAHGEVLEYDSTIQKTQSYGMDAAHDIIELVSNGAFLNS